MDAYDELRQKLGLGDTGSSSPTPTQTSDPYDDLRVSFGLIQDTRPKPVTSPDEMDNAFRREAQTTPTLQPQVELQQDPGAADSSFRQENTPLLGRNLPVIGPILKGLDYVSSNPISQAIAEYTVPDAPYIDQPGTNARQSFLDRSGQEAATGVSKFIGQAAAPFFVPGAGLGTGSSVRNAADNLTSRMGQGLGQTVAREAAIGGAVGFGSEYAQGQGDLGQAAITGAAGAALGGAFPLLGAGVRSASNAAGRSLAQAAERPSLSSAVDDFIRRVNSSDAPTPTGRITQELPAPTYSRSEQLADNFRWNEQPTMARTETRSNPYAQKLDELYQAARQEQLPPGREREALDDLWSRMAGPNDPGLDQLIELATPTLRDMQRRTPGRDLLSRAKETQQAREVAGVPLPVKSAADRFLTNPIRQAVPVGEMQQAPRPTLREAAQPLGRDIQPDPKIILQRAYDEVNAAKGSKISMTISANTGMLDVMRQSGAISEVEYKAAMDHFSKKLKEFHAQDRPLDQEWVNTLSRGTQPAPREPATLQRGFTDTLIQSDKTAPGLRDRLKTAYTPISNETSVSQANKRINSDLEAAASYVMGKSPTSAEKVTTAHRVIDEFSKAGNYERANDIADKIAAELTKAGQSIQAASIYNRLSPEGILIHAKRIAKSINDKLPIISRDVKVTDDMAAQITEMARTTQKMQGVKDLSNDVINILDKAKSGGALSETEASTLRTFVQESKQFIKESTSKPRAPRAPQQPKDKRVRDNVVSFLDAQEAAAKERLRARGVQISSTPLDVWADYAVIGAAKMAKGAIKFAEWSEQMVKDLGENIRPQLQHLYEKSVEAFEQSTKRVTRQTISEAEKLTESVIKNKQLEPAAADSLRSLAQKVSGLSGEEKRLASQDLQSILQSLERPGTLKRVSSIQTMGQLLNPKTQVRNALGNELFYRVERVNKMLSTPIDIVRSKVTGGDRTVTFRTNNQGEYWTNWMRGLKAGWRGTNVNGLETQYDLASPAFRGKYNPLTYMEKSLGAALKSFDTAAYMRAYNNTIGEMATLRVVNEGQAGNKALIQKYIREADDNMMKIADEYGRYVTFQDNNAISNTLVKAKRTLNLGKDFGLGDLVLKYPKTPGAILMRALEYSPAGFIRSGMILARPWWKKEPNTAEATQALSRAMIGTFGLTGLGYFLMDSGIVTGSASKDRDVRDLQKSAGQGQYQVNLSALKRLAESGFDAASSKLKEGDLLYTYDWMQPISMAISMGANISKNMSEGKQKLSGLAGTAYNSVEGGLGTLTEQSVLQGLKRAAQGSPGQTVTDKITDILSDIPASFVPTAANQAKQLTDNSRPETYSPNKLEQSLNRAQAKIPGLAGKLPKQYDTLGRAKENYQDNSTANVLLNPGFASRYELSPEAKMVVDLINETGDETLAPRVPSKSITVDGKSVKLTGDQFSRFQQLQGEETQKEIVKRYKPGESLKSRSKRMEDILRDSGTKARDQLKKEIK